MRGLALGKPTHFGFVLRGNSEILARLRALIFRRGGGSESNAIFTIIQKEFLIQKIFWYTCYAHNIIR
jgi:hypothetical protein